MIPISLRLRNGTTARIPGRARAACASSTSYVKLRKSGSGRATETSTQVIYAVRRDSSERLRHLRREGVDHPRQADGERRPFAEHAVDGDLTAQLLGQSPRNAESKSRSTVGARSRLVELPEILPNQIDLFGFDADAGVDHVEHDRVARTRDVDPN